ncbi:MAG TPA: MBL fold metallo-hydrolase [Kofleriaceae bacterium]|nr:MBL fold metallo-hydrolase [Kofleriaceae bacterium]
MRPVVPVGSFLAHIARRRSHSRADQAAQRELASDALAGALPRGLELTWLGTAGFRLRYQGQTLLIDPYLTRLPLRRFLSRRVARPDTDAIARHIDGADAVLVGHSHFDHVLDVPFVARATGARVYGSRSTAHLMGLSGLAHQAVEVEPYRVYDIGPFQVTFVPSAHARLLLGVAVPMSGDITCDHLDDLNARAYGCGQVYGIHVRAGGVGFYHLGSAELEDEAVIHRGVDVLLAAIAGRGFSPRFLPRVLRRLEPAWLVPHHHDDFFRPLDQPMQLSFNVDLAGCADELRRLSRDLQVATLMPLEPLRGA